jgi:hypothetical protein
MADGDDVLWESAMIRRGERRNLEVTGIGLQFSSMRSPPF